MTARWNRPLVAALLLALAAAPAEAGRIGGRVVNASRGEVAVGGAEVLLQVRIDGQFAVVERTTADDDGRFSFVGLPVDQGLIFMAGSNREGIHYPGPRLMLSPEQPSAEVVVKVHDTVAEPSPLVIRDGEIVLRPEPGALRVAERMIIENPGPATYVGKSLADGAEPVTLQLGIPGDFERVTFDEEFYGRNFSLIHEKLVTGVPWTPGQRTLAFTYVVRQDGTQRDWTRTLDLPCRNLRVTILTDAPAGVTSNLGNPLRQSVGSLTFETTGRTLPAGYSIRVGLGRVPVSVMAYARWFVLAGLAVAIVATALLATRRRQVSTRSQPVALRGPHRHRRPARSRSRHQDGSPSA